ncbi:unnamed protein product [Bursaphelenchus okinawaensis]|uniref:ANK_REP_REGION domain-containing protein n=1 Tax=Bursaphelenchus okinawaensis TaxID=465554 RepID=A0A811K846_9BILA|nr:unnamed protein product [Bursaphelenchus okinawaensis]CAG9093770.1 unnamed protein product [Bursaphelenchus okinawaensis]
MVLDDDDEGNRITHNEIIQGRMNVQNNVINRRREQLQAWEGSEMNRLPAVRKPVNKSKVKFQDSDIFFSACVSGDEEEVVELLAKGANVNTTTIDGVTPLHQSVIDGNFEMVRFLLDHGADINAQDNEGWTPLHAAVCCGNLNILEYLYDKGADITITNTDKELPVDLAEDDTIKHYLEERLQIHGLTADECRQREEKVMLKDCMDWIRNGAYLDKPHPRTGATALHVAASKGYNKLISLLVQAGADVNARDFEGWTPLHAAAHWGEKEACRILISRGADVNAESIAGQNVLRVADANILESLEQMAEEFAARNHTLPLDQVDLNAEADNDKVQSNVNMHSSGKRLSIGRMNSLEKDEIKKKDEHDENVSLHGQNATRSQHSLSPPPAKKVNENKENPVEVQKAAPPQVPPKSLSLKNIQMEELEDEEWEDEEEEVEEESEVSKTSSAVTPVTNTTLYLPKTYQVPGANRVAIVESDKSQSSQSSSTLSVQAVLPAPRGPSGSETSTSYSSGSYSTSGSTSLSSSQSASTSSSQPSKSLNDDIPRKDDTPTPLSQRKASSVTSRTVNSPRKHESLEDDEVSAETVSSASEASNTSASISSIQTRSRSMTPRDTSSSLYSSDQSVKCTLKVQSQPQQPSTATPKKEEPEQKTQSAEQNQSQNQNLKMSEFAQPASPVNRAPLARISMSPSTESLTSSESSVVFRKPAIPPHQVTPTKTSPTKVTVPGSAPAKPSSSASSIIQRLNSLNQPTVSSLTRQKPPMLRSQSVAVDKFAAAKFGSENEASTSANNPPPWVGHWRNERGVIQVGPKPSVSGMVKANEGYRDFRTSSALSNGSVSSAASDAFQNNVFRKSIQQTPPTQPAPQKESEAERKAKSRLQRASRRSTQGVTQEQLSEVRGCASNSSSAVSTPTSSRQQMRVEDDANGKWKKDRYGVPKQSSQSTEPVRSTIPSGSSLSQLNQTRTPPTLPGETPSAAKMRRAQVFRNNRRGTGPVEMEGQMQEPIEFGTPVKPSPYCQSPQLQWKSSTLNFLSTNRKSNTARVAPFSQVISTFV